MYDSLVGVYRRYSSSAELTWPDPAGPVFCLRFWWPAWPSWPGPQMPPCSPCGAQWDPQDAHCPRVWSSPVTRTRRGAPTTSGRTRTAGRGTSGSGEKPARRTRVRGAPPSASPPAPTSIWSPRSSYRSSPKEISVRIGCFMFYIYH